MGRLKYLKEQNREIQIIGLQPSDGSSIAGICRWPEADPPTIFDRSRVDRIIDIPQIEAEKRCVNWRKKKASAQAHHRAVRYGQL